MSPGDRYVGIDWGSDGRSVAAVFERVSGRWRLVSEKKRDGEMIITAEQIIGWGPCRRYPPERVKKLVGAGVTPEQVLDSSIRIQDRHWVLAHLLDWSEQRYCAAAAAERVLMTAKSVDIGAWNAVYVARLAADGDATDEMLRQAVVTALPIPVWRAYRKYHSLAASYSAQYFPFLAITDAVRCGAHCAGAHASDHIEDRDQRGMAYTAASNAAWIMALADVMRFIKAKENHE